MKDIKRQTQELTEAEKDFCQLYVYGGVDYAGQATACYKECFANVEGKNYGAKAAAFIRQDYIEADIKRLVDTPSFDTETIAVKLQISETLKKVMSETSKSEYQDKYGMTLSPAPLRAVSVNAAKALMEIYPVKHTSNTINNCNSESGITFNVIIPQSKSPSDEEVEP